MVSPEDVLENERGENLSGLELSLIANLMKYVGAKASKIFNIP